MRQKPVSAAALTISTVGRESQSSSIGSMRSFVRSVSARNSATHLGPRTCRCSAPRSRRSRSATPIVRFALCDAIKYGGIGNVIYPRRRLPSMRTFEDRFPLLGEGSPRSSDGLVWRRCVGRRACSLVAPATHRPACHCQRGQVNAPVRPWGPTDLAASGRPVVARAATNPPFEARNQRSLSTEP